MEIPITHRQAAQILEINPVPYLINTKLLDSVKLPGLGTIRYTQVAPTETLNPCFLTSHHPTHYYHTYHLTDIDPKSIQIPLPDVLNAQQLNQIALATLQELLPQKKKKNKNTTQSLVALVDALQESNHPKAELFLQFYEFLKAVETISNTKHNIHKLSEYEHTHCYRFTDGYFVLVEHIPVDVEGTTIHDTKSTIVPLKDVPVDDLLRIIKDTINLPSKLPL